MAAYSAELESELRQQLGNAGFNPLTRSIFKWTKSPAEVSHVVFFEVWRGIEPMLTAWSAASSVSAERFATSCLQATGLRVYESLRTRSDKELAMRFALGRVAMWAERSSIPRLSTGIAQSVQIAVASIQDVFVPLCNRTRTKRELADYLCQDCEPFPWLFSNEALRVAAIAWLRHTSGDDLADVVRLLEDQRRGVSNSLRNEVTRDVFLGIIKQRLEAEVRDVSGGI
jgi:hypothetical protein